MRIWKRSFVFLISTVLLVQALVSPISAAEGLLDWGKLEEITDPDDYFIDTNGNPTGYLDKNIVTAEHEGELYVAWETTERDKGGSMIVIRSMRNDYWGAIRTIAGSEDGYIDTQPALAHYNGDLYLVWMRASGSDTEIYCQVLHAEDWSSCGEVSGTDDFGNDNKPTLGVYNGLLWASWMTRSSVTGMDPNGGDVVLRSYDGQLWSEEILVVNPTPANGMDDEPKLAVFNDKLVITWLTKDDDISEGTDQDIVLREYDGSAWSEIIEVTSPDGPGSYDTFLEMEVYNDRLFIVWQSEGDMQFETDIHIASYDGAKVSAERNLIPADNNGADEHPTLTVFEDRLYVAWNSNDINFTVSADDDIVISYYDGETWTGPEEVTERDISTGGHEHGIAAQDRFPVMDSLDGALYLFWEQDEQRSALLDPGDIKYKRHPPLAPEFDSVLVALFLVIVIVIMMAVLFGVLGPKRTARQKRYIERREREDIRKRALSKAGGKSRRKSGRKGKKKRR